MNYNILTPAQAERLALLAEEMGEAIQAIGKILRHGYDPPGYTNRDALEEELGHVGYAIALMRMEGDLEESNIDKAFDIKAENIIPYLHHQRQENLDELQDS